MRSLITSYLLQSKECALQHIGTFKIINTPATTDVVNNRLLPPFQGIIFKKGNESVSTAFVKYIAAKKNISEEEAKNLLDNFCNEWKEKIDVGEKLSLEKIGSIQKNGDGVIYFQKEGIQDFLQPVAVNDIYKKVEAPILVEQQKIVENDVEPEPDKKDISIRKSYWWLWSVILAVIASAAIFYNFKDHNSEGKVTGNQNSLSIDSANATHYIPK